MQPYSSALAVPCIRIPIYILYLYHLRGPWVRGPGGPGLNVRPQEFGRLARHGLFPWLLIAVCACGKQRLACCVCGYVGDEAGTTVEGCFRFRSVSSGNQFSPCRKTILRFRITERDELIRQRLVGGMVLVGGMIWNKLERLYLELWLEREGTERFETKRDSERAHPLKSLEQARPTSTLSGSVSLSLTPGPWPEVVARA
jgi:hypothetical protein